MDRRMLLGLLLVALALNTASAAPFTVKVLVNGVDPSAETAVVSAGEAADVSLDVSVTSPNVEISSIEFTSSPLAFGGVLEAFVEKRVEFPKTLEPFNDVNSYELPGIVPGGDYSITAKVHYTGDRQGVWQYDANLRVENEGILSMILSLLLKVLPKSIVKPIAGLLV